MLFAPPFFDPSRVARDFAILIAKSPNESVLHKMDSIVWLLEHALHGEPIKGE